jgi:hypothetical protein
VKSLAAAIAGARDRHRERHRPTGFGFALADGIDFLDGTRWDGLTKNASGLLARPYLRVLEELGPENLAPRYAMIFRGRHPVAAVAAQSVRIDFDRLRKGGKPSALGRLEERVLVCGNLLCWGFHGVAFAEGEDRAALWPAVAEALYRLRRADRLAGDTDFVLVKDLPASEHGPAEALSRFSYRAVETEPDMVLELDPRWKTYDDYLGALSSKYRKGAVKIAKDVAAAGGTETRAAPCGRAERLHALYLDVHREAKLRLFTLPQDFLPSLAEAFGDAFRCTLLRVDGEIAGFVTTLRDRDGVLGYHIGFDRARNEALPLYFRLLQLCVADAIAPAAPPPKGPARRKTRNRSCSSALAGLAKAVLSGVHRDEAPNRTRSRKKGARSVPLAVSAPEASTATHSVRAHATSRFSGRPLALTDYRCRAADAARAHR